MSDPCAGMMVTTNVRLVRALGEGGMGTVWVAEHLSLRTNVVVKFMTRSLACSPEAIARFSREAAAASQVKSPHVVQMLDHGVAEDGAPYIVMELLEGKDLEAHVRTRGKLPSDELVAIVTQLARALSKAHERGIVHRDVKPSNVFLLDAGSGELFVKLLDFGIAKGPEVGSAGSTTRTGSLVGSPYYMSPEQVVGARDIDFRTDLWSLGVVVFEALTGEKPFRAPSVGALAIKIHRDPLPVPSILNPALPSAVDAWFARACAREPAARFGSAREMAESLAVAVLGESAGESARPMAHFDSAPSVGERRRQRDGHATAWPATEGWHGAEALPRVSAPSTGKSVHRSTVSWWLLGAMAAIALATAGVAALLAGTAKAKVVPAYPPAVLDAPVRKQANDSPTAVRTVRDRADEPSPADDSNAHRGEDPDASARSDRAKSGDLFPGRKLNAEPAIASASNATSVPVARSASKPSRTAATAPGSGATGAPPPVLPSASAPSPAPSGNEDDIK